MIFWNFTSAKRVSSDGEVRDLDDCGGRAYRKAPSLHDSAVDAIQSFDTVVIAPITSFNAGGNAYRIFVLPTAETGLKEDSFIEVEKLSAVKKRFLGKQIGKVPPEAFDDINEATARLLGIETS
jgi:mRNA-degrading endonuclease toxin of MazEF toxin-antitoxin module